MGQAVAAEVLVTFVTPTQSASGDLYWGRALGRVASDGLWEGWLEFSLAGSEEVVKTGRETEQPNRDDLVYWAEGLTDIYLQGALERALHPEPVAVLRSTGEHVVSAPRTHRPSGATPLHRVVLNPFTVYAEGELVLRNQLRALSRDHVQSIVEAYGFVDSSERDWARAATQDTLADRIVERVRKRYAAAADSHLASDTDIQPGV